MTTTPLDEMLEAGERVIFRTRARPSRLKALALGLFLTVLFFAALFIVYLQTDYSGVSLPVTGMIGGMLLPTVFCFWLQAEITITDRRILLGGGFFAWLFGKGPNGLSIDPSDINRITTTDSSWPSNITLVLKDDRRFNLWVFKRHRLFEQSLKDLLGEPSRWTIVTE